MPPTEHPPPRTLGEVLEAATTFLTRHQAPEPRLASEWLAARLLKCRRLELRMRYEKLLTTEQMEAMRRGTRRVASGEPVQYVVGQWEFRGHPLQVDRRALIPRPETEQLVELALGDRTLWENPRPRIVDVGTGSGCIAVSLALERPQGLYLATDLSEEALELARENAVLNQVQDRIRFAPGDLSDLLDPASVDAVISNPPYIPSALVDRLPVGVREFEPRMALDGGEDGTVWLRQIAEEATMALRNGGRLFLELSAEQHQAGAMIRFLGELGFENIRPLRDLSGVERFVSATLAEGL